MLAVYSVWVADGREEEVSSGVRATLNTWEDEFSGFCIREVDDPCEGTWRFMRSFSQRALCSSASIHRRSQLHTIVSHHHHPEIPSTKPYTAPIYMHTALHFLHINVLYVPCEHRRVSYSVFGWNVCKCTRTDICINSLQLMPHNADTPRVDKYT